MARTFEELLAWQLANELKLEVLDLVSKPPAHRDFKFRDQILDSSSSGPSNIAEGFGRGRPAEFARFLEFAKASIAETRNHLIDAHARGYIADRLFSRLSNLARAAERTTTGLLRDRQRAAAGERNRKRLPTRVSRTR